MSDTAKATTVATAQVELLLDASKFRSQLENELRSTASKSASIGATGTAKAGKDAANEAKRLHAQEMADIKTRANHAKGVEDALKKQRLSAIKMGAEAHTRAMKDAEAATKRLGILEAEQSKTRIIEAQTQAVKQQALEHEASARRKQQNTLETKQQEANIAYLNKQKDRAAALEHAQTLMEIRLRNKLAGIAAMSAAKRGSVAGLPDWKEWLRLGTAATITSGRLLRALHGELAIGMRLGAIGGLATIMAFLRGGSVEAHMFNNRLSALKASFGKVGEGILSTNIAGRDLMTWIESYTVAIKNLPLDKIHDMTRLFYKLGWVLASLQVGRFLQRVGGEIGHSIRRVTDLYHAAEKTFGLGAKNAATFQWVREASAGAAGSAVGNMLQGGSKVASGAAKKVGSGVATDVIGAAIGTTIANKLTGRSLGEVVRRMTGRGEDPTILRYAPPKMTQLGKLVQEKAALDAAAAKVGPITLGRIATVGLRAAGIIGLILTAFGAIASFIPSVSNTGDINRTIADDLAETGKAISTWFQKTLGIYKEELVFGEDWVPAAVQRERNKERTMYMKRNEALRSFEEHDLESRLRASSVFGKTPESTQAAEYDNATKKLAETLPLIGVARQQLANKLTGLSDPLEIDRAKQKDDYKAVADDLKNLIELAIKYNKTRNDIKTTIGEGFIDAEDRAKREKEMSDEYNKSLMDKNDALAKIDEDAKERMAELLETKATLGRSSLEDLNNAIAQSGLTGLEKQKDIEKINQEAAKRKDQINAPGSSENERIADLAKKLEEFRTEKTKDERLVASSGRIESKLQELVSKLTAPCPAN